MRDSRIKKALKALVAALLYLAVWQGASMLVKSELRLPGPLPVARSLAALAATGAFWQLSLIHI